MLDNPWSAKVLWDHRSEVEFRSLLGYRIRWEVLHLGYMTGFVLLGFVVNVGVGLSDTSVGVQYLRTFYMYIIVSL